MPIVQRRSEDTLIDNNGRILLRQYLEDHGFDGVEVQPTWSGGPLVDWHGRGAAGFSKPDWIRALLRPGDLVRWPGARGKLGVITRFDGDNFFFKWATRTCARRVRDMDLVYVV